MASPITSSPSFVEKHSKRGTNEIKVIQELFQDYNALGYKQALAELDQSLLAEYPIIIIEPPRLGDDTVRWILVGNFLHRSVVWAGLTSCISSGILPEKYILWLPVPFAAISISSFVVYTVCWTSDPCRNYQVEKDKQNLSDLNLNTLSSSNSVVVLRWTDDFKRRCTHSAIAMLTISVFAYRLYKFFYGK